MSRLVALFAVFVLVGATALDARAQVRKDEEQPEDPPPAPVLTKAPTVVESAVPDYPPAAIEQGLEAAVKIRVHIDAEGNVTNVEVIEPVGNGFDEAAVNAAMQYKFTPAEWDGVPGPIVVETAINFVLQVEPEPDPVPDPPPTGDDDDDDGAIDPASIGPPEHGGDFRQPVTIKGEAVERGTRNAIAGVIVSVAELGLDAVTNADGDFYFHGVPPGNYTIIAIDDNYDRFSRDMVLADDEQVEIRLWMRPRGGNPYETIVEGEREVLEVTKRTLQRKQLTSVPGTFGDPIRVIQSLPGLARTPFVTGFLVIRGSNPDDSGVFIDGHRVPLLFHFLGGPSILNAEFLDSIDLYPGGYPARFGRALGGIVSIDTRSGENDGVHGSADIDLLDTSGYIRTPVGDNGTFAIAGRRSYLDFMLSFFLPEPDEGATLIVTPVYWDFQARYDHDFKEEGKASVFVIGSSDTLDVLQQDAGEEESLDLSSDINFFRVIGSYKRPISGDLNLTLSPAYGRDSIGFGGGEIDGGGNFSSVDIVQDTLSYRMRIDGRLSKRLYLDSGLDIESRVTKYDLLVPIDDDIPSLGQQIDIPPDVLERNIEQLAYGVHADLAIDVTEDLRVVPGLRLDGYILSTQDRFSVDPRLVTRYRLNQQWLAKGYVGLFHQPPQPEAVDTRFGNPEVGLERAVQTGLGAEYNPTKLWTIDGEVYFIDRTDLVHFTSDVVEDPDTGDVEPLNFINVGVSDTVGLELLVKREVTRNFYGWLSYTLSWSRQRRFPDDEYRPTLFDQRHTLNIVGSYSTDNGWEFGGRFRLASGRPITEIVGSTFDIDENAYDSLNGPSRAGRRPTFHQLDVRAEKTWLFNNWRLGLYLDIQNVLNVENVEAVQWDYRYRESSPVTGVPFIPTLGLRGQW